MPGLSFRDIGEMEGGEAVTLLATQNPPRSHPVPSRRHRGRHGTHPNGALPAEGHGSGRGAFPVNFYAPPQTAVPLASGQVASAGRSSPNNRQPYLSLNWCIALQGIFPPRQ